MSYTTLNPTQVAIVALLPKRAWGLTPQQIVQATGLPLARVQLELHALTKSGYLVFDADKGEYRNPGERA